MSQIHTGIVGTGGGAGRAMHIAQVSQVLWQIRFSDTEQVYTGRTLGGALSKAMEARVDAKDTAAESVVVALAQASIIMEHLMGVRR